MILRKLKESQYQEVHKLLYSKGQYGPTEASVTLPMTVSGTEYQLKFQLERHHRLAILQALKFDRQEKTPGVTLITEGRVLSSFLEIFLYQEIAG